MENEKGKRSDYSKSSKKGKPISVRFEAEKVDLIFKKENLKTVQQVVDFLVDKYWWESKVGANPVMERQQRKEITYSETKTSSYDGEVNSKVKNDESGQYQEPTYSTQWFRDAFYNSKTREELAKMVALMEQKILGSWSQGKLKEYAKEIFEEKFNF